MKTKKKDRKNSYKFNRTSFTINSFAQMTKENTSLRRSA